MKFSTIPLLVTALASVATADELVYGLMFTPPHQNTARAPSVNAIKPAYSRIESQVFSLSARQTCGHGSTCKEVCEGCGIPYCGIDTDGTCICANKAGSCVRRESESESGSQGGSESGGTGAGGDSEGDYTVSPYCGWGATCLESCDACGTDYCGVRLQTAGRACVCRSLDGECPAGSAGDRGGSGRGNGTRSDSGVRLSTTSGTDLPKSTGDVSSETTTSEVLPSTTKDSALPLATTQTPGAAPGRMGVAVGAAVVGVAALVMVL
ncbi:hypothetical protein VE02_05593 [Pseudogymnoascus sp. 03VT05]|nr:hypothetical protein VE02_05593 [Pseudogymnoascus sp. 03VT05]